MLKNVGYFKRSYYSRAQDWTQTDAAGNIVVPYGFAPGFKWMSEVQQFMTEMSNDIGCIVQGLEIVC